MENKVIIVGAFHETIELCELCQCTSIGVIDSITEPVYMGYPVLGSDADSKQIFEKHSDCKIVISPDSSKIKRKIASYYSNIGFDFASIISPRAFISKTAKIGKGVVIQSGVNISSNVELGDFCKVNFNANIMHDVQVGDFSIIAPNVVVLGRAHIGNDVYIGANSTICPDTIIPAETKINPADVVK